VYRSYGRGTPEKFRHEVLWCAEDKGNHKATAVLEVDESNVRLWQKQKAAISKCEVSRKKFTGPKKGRFPEIDDAVLRFSQELQDWNKLYSIIPMACTEALSLFQNPALDRKSDPHMLLTCV
jgi:hypothetical protein